MRGGGVPDDPAMAEDGQDHAPRRRHQRTGARHEPAHHPRTARARPVRRGPVPPRHAVRRPEDRSRGPDRVPRQRPPGTWPRRTPHRERHGVHRHPHRHGRDRMPRRGRKAMDHTPGLGESELRGRVRDHHPQKPGHDRRPVRRHVPLRRARPMQPAIRGRHTRPRGEPPPLRMQGREDPADGSHAVRIGHRSRSHRPPTHALHAPDAPRHAHRHRNPHRRTRGEIQSDTTPARTRLRSRPHRRPPTSRPNSANATTRAS